MRAFRTLGVVALITLLSLAVGAGRAEAGPITVSSVGQSIDRQTQVRQDLVVDDIVHEYCVRVEGFARQNDAFVKSLILANSAGPVFELL